MSITSRTVVSGGNVVGLVAPRYRAAVARQRQGVRTRVVSHPAPVGGINTRDIRDALPETDAEDLVNWIADTHGLVVRPGYASHATGVGAGDVETLAALESASSQKLLAGGGGKIYDASSSGAATDLTPSKSYASNRWQTHNFTGRMFGCNGNDAPWDYDGTTFQDTSWTGPADITKLTAVWSHVSRLWFALDGSANAYYAGAGAVTGALAAFDLSQIANKGGYLVAGGAWSRDGGAGLEDMQVFVMSTGEIIVYQGTDPGTASAWVKVGSYEGAPPIGRRCVTKVGGDLAILTEAGYLPVSLIMQGWTIDAIIQNTMWGKIAQSVRDLAVQHRTTWGWQAGRVFPNGRMYFNYPESTTLFRQHCLNLQRGAWTRFIDLPARCWEYHNGGIYFGSAGGIVYQHTGVNDNGSDINLDVSGPFTYLGSRGSKKHVTAVRTVMAIEGTLTGGIALNADFSARNISPGSLSLAGQSVGSAWDEDDWDVADWASRAQSRPKWIGATAIGRNIGFRGNFSTAASLTWYSIDYLIKQGGAR